MSVRHFLEIDDLTGDEIATILDLAEQPEPSPVLSKRGVALIFEKPSNRTRNSMELAAFQLGGHPISMRAEEIGIGTRETIEDIARVLGRYHAVLGARVFDHRTVERMAEAAGVPVVNLLSDRGHPCQALADLLTLRQEWGGFDGRTLAYVGDGNNVCRSLTLAAALVGLHLRVACPPGYALGEADLDTVRRHGGNVEFVGRAEQAVKGADAVYTDTWTSMGQEEESGIRRRAFEGFCVDDRVMAAAAPDALFLHCLPAHRGEEVSASVIDGARSVVFQQAENRLHAARGLLLWLMGVA